MPSSINGCGTKYYGARDFRADGSHLTTNFFCLAFVPLIPLHTVRVIPDPKNSWLPFSKNYYVILEKRFPDILQVLSVYFAGAGAVALLIFMVVYVDPYLKENAPALAKEWIEIVFFLVALVPFFLIVRAWRNNAAQRGLAQPADPNDSTPIA